VANESAGPLELAPQRLTYGSWGGHGPPAEVYLARRYIQTAFLTFILIIVFISIFFVTLAFSIIIHIQTCNYTRTLTLYHALVHLVPNFKNRSHHKHLMITSAAQSIIQHWAALISSRVRLSSHTIGYFYLVLSQGGPSPLLRRYLLNLRLHTCNYTRTLALKWPR
jgi:hypothetical protein